MNPTKLQIETAETLLLNTINKKEQKLSKKNIEQDLKWAKTVIMPLNQKAIDLRKEYDEFEKNLKKETSLELSRYHSIRNKLPENIKSISEDQIEPQEISYGNELGKYQIKLTKEKKEIETFILNLKLGTALMKDLQTLLNKINSK